MDGTITRLTLEDGKSSKFWQVQIDGSRLQIYYGRIGTDGRSQTKEFADTAAAIAAAVKLIRRKTGKSYQTG